LPHDLLIFGASTRAAAMSALRCGLRPLCADYFADRDVAAICPVQRVDPGDAPRQLAALADSVAPSPWFYTGGLENHPDWVEQIARRHRLWGVGAETLRAVRDPFRLAEILRREQIPAPAVRRDRRGLPRDGSWLAKPLHSGGGRGIMPLVDEGRPVRRPHYFQERIDGPSFSALYIGADRQARLIGFTRQWIGIAGAPFAYRGSIGPAAIATSVQSKLSALGDALAAAFGLIGWFGVDYVLHRGDPWPVEVNPRYTASIEIHELALGRSLLAEHIRACERNTACGSQRASTALPRAHTIAKRILYAPHSTFAPKIVPDQTGPEGLWAVPSIADVPRPGTCFEAGEPVMTVLASGENPAACRRRLRRLERKWMKRLGFVAAASTASGRLTHAGRPSGANRLNFDRDRRFRV
jgi:predicted ATP-grasp superfamily ATP-dependent carboligase